MIEKLSEEMYSIPAKKNYETNKTVVKHIDKTWSLGFIDKTDYGIKKKKLYKYILVVIDKFSKHGWNIPLKKLLELYQWVFKNIL